MLCTVLGALLELTCEAIIVSLGRAARHRTRHRLGERTHPRAAYEELRRSAHECGAVCAGHEIDEARRISGAQRASDLGRGDDAVTARDHLASKHNLVGLPGAQSRGG